MKRGGNEQLTQERTADKPGAAPPAPSATPIRPKTTARRLRELLSGEDIVIAPGAFNAFSARLVERSGFDCLYLTGGGTGLGLGLPDVGLMTMTEMVNNAGVVADAVGVPVISDCDTGYGNVVNVWRSVQAFEKAGVAGVHIEDQTFPKKCGHLFGKQLVSQDEMVQKIRAACDARKDPDFVIIARCDALLVNGIEDAIRRSQAYAAAGADVLFIESPRTLDQIELIGRSFDVPLLFNMASSGKTPTLSAEQLHDLGYKLMILPIFTLLAAMKAIGEVLTDIKATGSIETIRERCSTFEDFMDLAGLPFVQELERRYQIPGESLTSI